MHEKNFIKRMSIVEDWVFIEGHLLDFGKVMRVWKPNDYNAIEFLCLSNVRIAFEYPYYPIPTGYVHRHRFDKSHDLSKEAWKQLLKLVERRFGGTYVTYVELDENDNPLGDVVGENK